MANADYLSVTKKSQNKQPMRVKKKGKRVQKGKIVNRKATNPGMIYLGHLPHGLYEKELREYLSQFGKVLRVHLSRSAKTGQSKGYAFVEMENADVAKVVAETMNNYLMMKKMLKAEVVPQDKVPKHVFRHRYNWNPLKNPHVTNSKKQRLQYNKNVNEDCVPKKIQRKVSATNRMLEKLRKAGLEHTLPISDKPDGFPDVLKAERKAIFKVDESDEEIELKIPPGAIIEMVRKKDKSKSKAVEKKSIVKKTKATAKLSSKNVSKLKMGLRQITQV